MTKAKELRELNLDELDQKLVESKHELFNLRFQLATGKQDNSARLGQVRKEIARVATAAARAGDRGRRGRGERRDDLMAAEEPEDGLESRPPRSTPSRPRAEPADERDEGRAGRPLSARRPRSNRRKVREGLVLSVDMDKTAVIGVIERVRHPRYVKTVQRTKRLYVHDPDNDLRVGDRVRIAETRPLSKLKRWRIVDVLERAK